MEYKTELPIKENMFSRSDTRKIIQYRDEYFWDFDHIAEALDMPYYAKEIEQWYERYSPKGKKELEIDKERFVYERIIGMKKCAEERRGHEFCLMDFNETAKSMIKPLMAMEDFKLCWELYRQNNYMKMYAPSLDHIKPVSKGGTDVLGNLQWLPFFANIWKLAENYSDWRNLVRQAPQFFIELDKLYSKRLAKDFDFGG